MKRFYYYFLLNLLSIINYVTPAVAQEAPKQIRSLELSLSQPLPDTATIDTYHKLHHAYLATDTAQAMNYLREAIKLGDSINHPERLCKSYLKMCDYLWRRGRLPEAKKALERVDHYRLSIDNTEIDAAYHIQQGVVLLKGGEYHDASEDFLKAAAMYEVLADTAGRAKCFNNLGNIYWELDQLDDAMQYYKEGLSLVEHTSYQKTRANFLGNIGLIYRAKGDYEQALAHYSQSLAIHRELGNKSGESIDLHNIGVLYTKQNRHHKALSFFTQAYEVCRQIDDQIGMLYANHAMATPYTKLGRYQLANDKVDAAISMAKQLGLKEVIKDLYRTQSEIYEEMGNYQQALSERKIYEDWKDSLINENHLGRIKELELQFETAKKNEELALLAREQEHNQAELQRKAILNNILIGSIALLVLIAVLIFYLYRQRLRNQKMLASKNEEVKAARFRQQLCELEMKALRVQMNPHFIFNCLNSINRMILSGEDREASRYLTKFSKLIRLILENSELSTVSLTDELTMLNAYLQLESLRFKEKMVYQLTVDPQIDQDATYLPSMVLQPFIENAIWHGIMHKKEAGLIKISIYEAEEGLRCTIEDNGIGREKSLALQNQQTSNKKSLGLQITEQRLKQFGKTGLKDLIRVTDLKNSMNEALGTRVDVIIPVS